jgi:hypothetical protein
MSRIVNCPKNRKKNFWRKEKRSSHRKNGKKELPPTVFQFFDELLVIFQLQLVDLFDERVHVPHS